MAVRDTARCDSVCVVVQEMRVLAMVSDRGGELGTDIPQMIGMFPYGESLC